MKIGERIKELRKSIPLTQLAFGEKIGLGATAIGQMESGDRNVTERTIILICEKYNINENWLRNGIEPIFNPTPTEELDKLAERYNLSPMVKKLVELVIKLNDDEMDIILRNARELVSYADAQNELSTTEEVVEYDPYQDDVVQAVIKERRLEKSMALSASQTTDLGNSKEKKIS